MASDDVSVLYQSLDPGHPTHPAYHQQFLPQKHEDMIGRTPEFWFYYLEVWMVSHFVCSFFHSQINQWSGLI
jgi:hypothetical protein